MSVCRFRRPDLDREIVGTLEFLEEAELALKYFLEQRQTMRDIRAALPMSCDGPALSMLDAQIAAFDGEIEVAEAMISDWREIKAALERKTAHP